jgi:acetyl esterase/lipase
MENNTLINISDFIARRFDDVVISGHAVAIRLRREIVGVTPHQIRAGVEGLSRLNPGRFGGSLHFEQIAGVNCGVVAFQGIKDENKRVVWIHGGGFSFGSARVYKATAIFLANALKCEVIIPEYKLAPEHPYPAGVDDAFSVFSDIAKKSGVTYLVGDSAGGNVAACVVMKCIKEKRPLPEKLALLSPWMDLSKGSQSNTLNSSEFSPFDKLDTVAFSREYIGDMKDDDPLVSPIFGSFKGFPETHVQGSEIEFLYTDAVNTVEALEKSNVKVTSHWEAKSLHAWHLMPDILPDAKRSMQTLADFFN